METLYLWITCSMYMIALWIIWLEDDQASSKSHASGAKTNGFRGNIWLHTSRFVLVWIANNETDICTHALAKIVTLFNGKEHSSLGRVGKTIIAIMALISRKMANMALV